MSAYHLIHPIKQNRCKFFHIKDVAPSKFPMIVASIVGLGFGVAGFYVVWKDGCTRLFHRLQWTSQQLDPAASLYFVAGLENLGNNCFINVVLQALASCSCFHSFLQNIIGAKDLLAVETTVQLPLIDALASLLKDLSILQGYRLIVSPKRVMQALELYVTSFNLSRQQDAAEALLHLLSSLREELIECYAPQYGSLADIPSLSSHFIFNQSSGNEWCRWRHLFGPLDGTLGSILTCSTCKVQLSMDFEFFHCLPLSPMLDSSGSIINGCTVEDCLKQYTSTEVIENYCCSRCWHVAGIKYLSLSKEENEMKIEKLRHCGDPDSCDCKDIFLQEGVSWPTIYSCAYKQLCIGRTPELPAELGYATTTFISLRRNFALLTLIHILIKVTSLTGLCYNYFHFTEILCLHLQRVSMSSHGEPTKLQGHISFPLVLDFLPFTAAVMLEEDVLKKDKQMQVSEPCRRLGFPLSKHLHIRAQTLPNIFPQKGSVSAGDNFSVSSNNMCIQTPKGEVSGHSADRLYDSKLARLVPQPLKRCIYRLLSVVEHYGRAASGHYALYRSVKVAPQAADSSGIHWFYASDAEVSNVNEEVVLSAEASLLFYERIEG